VTDQGQCAEWSAPEGQQIRTCHFHARYRFFIMCCLGIKKPAFILSLSLSLSLSHSNLREVTGPFYFGFGTLSFACPQTFSRLPLCVLFCFFYKIFFFKNIPIFLILPSSLRDFRLINTTNVYIAVQSKCKHI
jgi:hypothetical protein